MRPLRLLLAVSTSLIAVTLLGYAALGSPHNQEAKQASDSQGNIKALFSFTSPGSLFPPSAIISLTDDNSTFFLARPAAFGPLLPKDGLSSPLWIGSGFGDDTLGWAGELGCGDVPGWDHGSEALLASSRTWPRAGSNAARATLEQDGATAGSPSVATAGASLVALDDSTDEHYIAASTTFKSEPVHADIQSIQESAEIAGKVVLLKRGGCGFLAKVQWAQRRGGVAVIVGDDVRGGALVRMYAKGDTSNITIPSLFTSHTTAHLLSSLLPSQRMLRNPAPGNTAYSGPIHNHLGLDQIQGDEAQGDRKSRATLLHAKPKSSISTSRFTSEGVTSATKTFQNDSDTEGLLVSLLSALGFRNSQGKLPKAGSRRIPSSGDLDWTVAGDWNHDEDSMIKSVVPTATSSKTSDGFIIGQQDWRDPDLLPSPTTIDAPGLVMGSAPARLQTSANVLPGSGEYIRDDPKRPKSSWWKRWSSHRESIRRDQSSVGAEVRSVTSISGADLQLDTTSSHVTVSHEGLWVTLTPTSVSTSPFFDTLLVLVVSPLVTLTVVYALLLLRSRIRRRRWRAPKSVVERLPVRTYQTISEPSSSPTPGASSPTTPLLQRSTEQMSRSGSHSTSELPGALPPVQHTSPERAEEKRETGLAAWRRRYGGRQRECVVCLEEYEDGVSQVMSLPCGHEFHADCMPKKE
ncbi:hypothetical protein T440DRAFT_513010 [Plenodomus tracheiphilus IPT5]|uniref:RING-type E3 ubiquitin transferase n=1 Tax=Plenodomus tracheiphilus IPT5 TaxID=1408161 RepID=A0A6A7BNM6_9PLEO|nr:hypothetical protein T440DRAFT_513010 [Plenodomus tracheiphilus IPT5]